MEIKRDVYLNRLIIRKNNGFIKVITGIRRSGKSYLLNKLFYDHLIAEHTLPDHIIRFAFDSAEDLLQIGENPIFAASGKDKGVDPEKFLSYINTRIKDSETYYLLLDEVQRLGAFELVLNSFLKKENVDVYVTGSNSRFLSSDILTEFGGRGDEVHVQPLSFSEFYSVFEGSKEEAFDSYMVYGGFPAVCLMKTDEQKENYLLTQMSSIYLKDIEVRYNLHSDNTMGKLLDIIASGISTLVNPRKLSSTFKSVEKAAISESTVSRYISYMEDAFMLKRAIRYDVKSKKYISTPFKIYFEDIGLRNARLNFRQIEGTHIMENIIYNELRYRGYLVDVGAVELRKKNKEGKEIQSQLEVDFIATQGSKKYYIQSAYAIDSEKKYNQEIQGFNCINDSFKKIILVEKSMKPRRDDKGYLLMGVKEFLLNPNSLES
jgi:predicted AAA+ superfamily ATPase